MKANLYAVKCGLVLIVVFATSFAISHEGHEKKKTEYTESKDFEKINADYLKTVKPIFQKACFDCHSSVTNMPWYGSIPGVKQFINSDIAAARKHLDMTNDFPFVSHATPKTDLESISKSIAEESMPPFRYRFMHSTASLSESDRKQIQTWIQHSLQGLPK